MPFSHPYIACIFFGSRRLQALLRVFILLSLPCSRQMRHKVKQWYSSNIYLPFPQIACLWEPGGLAFISPGRYTNYEYQVATICIMVVWAQHDVLIPCHKCLIPNAFIMPHWMLMTPQLVCVCQSVALPTQSNGLSTFCPKFSQHWMCSHKPLQIAYLYINLWVFWIIMWLQQNFIRHQ